MSVSVRHASAIDVQVDLLTQPIFVVTVVNYGDNTVQISGECCAAERAEILSDNSLRLAPMYTASCTYLFAAKRSPSNISKCHSRPIYSREFVWVTTDNP